MKKLVICDPRYGDMTVVGEDIETEFRKIMESGYGGKLPAVFIAEKSDGSIEKATGKDAEKFLKDPMVDEVTIIAPIAGG